MPADIAPKPCKKLNPVIEISDVPHVMVTQFLSAVPQAIPGSSEVNLVVYANDITSAPDILMHGF